MVALKTYTREFGANFNLAAPVMLSQAGNVLVGLVDSFMLARIGDATMASCAVSASALGNSVFVLALLIGIGVSVGMTPHVAYYNAQSNRQQMIRIFRNGFYVNVIVGTGLAFLVYSIAPLLRSPFLGQDHQVAWLAIPYLRIIGFSIIPIVLLQTFKQFADGLGYTLPGMVATIAGNLVNVAANYALIYGNWGCPALGVEGAAWGTFISRVSMVLVLVVIFIGRKTLRYYIFHIRLLSGMCWDSTRKILSVGIPSAFQSLFEAGIFSASTIFVGRFGQQYQAAHQIAMQFATLAYTFVSGLGVAATVRIGYCYGKKKIEEMKRVMTSLILMAIVMSLGFSLFFVLGRNAVPSFFFTDAPEVVAIAAPLFVIAAFFETFDGIQSTVFGGLRGVQDVKVPTLYAFTGYWLISFPIFYILGDVLDMRANGVWIGLAAGLFFCCVMMTRRFFRSASRMQVALKNDVSL